MYGHQDINLLTMPSEWKEVLRNPRLRAEAANDRVGGGGNLHGASGRHGAYSSNGDRYGNYERDRGGGDTKEHQWRAKHPERYGRDVTNPRVDPSIKAALAPITDANGSFKWKDLMRAANTQYRKLSSFKGYKTDICARYSSGFCFLEGCDAMHLFDNELPKGYAKGYCKIIKPGVEKMMNEIADGNGKGNKRRRTNGGTSNDNGSDGE